MHRKEQVFLGVETTGAQDTVEGRPVGGVQFLGVELLGGGETGNSPVSRDPGADGDPGQPDRAARFGREEGRVLGRESETPFVGDEPGMAGLVAFELGVVELRQPSGADGCVIDPGVGGERGGEFSDEVAQRGAVDSE